MIPIELQWLVFLGLMVFLAGIIGVWIAYESLRRARRARANRDLVQCRLCATVFRAGRFEGLPRCPACGSPNEHSPPRTF